MASGSQHSTIRAISHRIARSLRGRRRLTDTAGMAKQPSKPQAPPLASWDVYKAVSKAVLLGDVEAANADAAREARGRGIQGRRLAPDRGAAAMTRKGDVTRAHLQR